MSILFSTVFVCGQHFVDASKGSMMVVCSDYVKKVLFRILTIAVSDIEISLVENRILERIFLLVVALL